MKSLSIRRVRLLPINWLSAAAITFLGSLALLQLGVGAAIGQAWRQRTSSATLDSQAIVRLEQLVDRLRSVELVVVLCVIVTLMLWSFFAVVNVRLAARSHRSPLIAMASWTLIPAVVMVVAELPQGSRISQSTWWLVVIEALLLFVPFSLLGGATESAGGSRAGFTHWYLATVLALVVHQAYPVPDDLATAGTVGELRQHALLLFLNGFVIGITALMGIDATRGLHRAVADRAFWHNSAGDQVAERFNFVPKKSVNHPAAVGPSVSGTEKP